MYRTIATLILCLAVAPLAHAQYGGNAYPGPQANPFDNGQLKQQMPWVPPVPPVGPSSYGRSQSTQYFLNYLLLYSGYYGPYWGNAENANPSSGYGNRYGSSGQSATTQPYGQNSYGQNPAKENTYKPTQPSRAQPLATAAYPNHEPLLQGLAGLKLSDVHVQRGDIVDARVWMRPKELSTLTQSVNGNAQLYRNAERLTEQLQGRGLLHAGDRVVGYADGKVYVLLAGAR